MGHSPPHLPTDTSTDQATILNLNFDAPGYDDPGSFPSRPTTVPQAASCYPLLENKQPVVIKEAKKLSIPYYDPAKLSWSSFALKLHAALIECDLAYLLREHSTTAANATHSKELMIELFKKLQGTAISLFNSMKAQRYYLEGGRGIEMIQALVNKFHPMDNRAIHTIISSMQSLTLVDTEELSVYKDKLENYNLQLSWVGQEMSPSFLVFLAQSQLGKSRYKKDIEALQHSYTASGTSFLSLDDLCAGLERLDKLRGLPYGGAAPLIPPSIKPTPSGPTIPKPKANVGFVAATTPTAKDANVDSSDNLEMHKDAWVGAINLP
jgi:hypothetical protein